MVAVDSRWKLPALVRKNHGGDIRVSSGGECFDGEPRVFGIVARVKDDNDASLADNIFDSIILAIGVLAGPSVIHVP